MGAKDDAEYEQLGVLLSGTPVSSVQIRSRIGIPAVTMERGVNRLLIIGC